MDDLAWLWPVLAAPFIGSFLGVVVNRLPEGRTVLGRRSACDHCGRSLGPLDLVPIVSWLALRGRCRQCGAQVSPLSTIIELGCMLAAIWAASIADGIAALWASCVFGWCLIALAAIDIRDGLLPDALTLPLLAAGLAVNYFLTPWQLLDCVIGAVAGFAAFWIVAFLYRTLRKREGLGLGDAKLLAAVGAWLSWTGLPSVVLVAALLGLAAALVLAWRGRQIALDQRLAFGPALCFAAWLVWLYGPLGAL
jgi:leader peptidase (prepilin peptidase)/N-methyltransferase